MQKFLRFLIALVLLAASGGKLLDLPGFVLVLRSYRFFPVDILWPIAVGITGVELLLALWLISGCSLALAAKASVGLHSVYALWAVFMLLRGKPIVNCGCFGSVLARPLSWMTVVEDLVMVSLSVALLRLCRHREP